MGTDIHVVEKKISSVGGETLEKPEWHMIYSASPIRNENGIQWSNIEERNYKRFAKLAGVRGEGPRPLGMPLNASIATRHLFEEEGDHSCSYMPLEQFLKIVYETEWVDLDDFYKYHLYAYYFPGLIYDSKSNREDFRVVFWFDS